MVWLFLLAAEGEAERPFRRAARQARRKKPSASVWLYSMRTKGVRWSYLLPIAAVHVVAALAVFPWFFSWSAFAAAALGIFVFGQGINLCYHRVLTHRSAKLAAPVERFFVLLALCCLEDTPAKWVAIHRLHHRHSDQPEDPHTPKVRPGFLGVLWSHVGWLFVHNPSTHSFASYMDNAHDVLEDP